MKSVPMSTFAIALVAFLGFAPHPSRADDGRLSDREAITALIHCYARGTDAIGDAKTHADPRAAGLAIYRECFTADAQFRVWAAQQPFDSQTFPTVGADAGPPTVGPEAWAKFVDQFFRQRGYTFTQHMMSNIDAKAHGETGTLTAYLNASHIISGAEVGGPSRCVAVANGTYSLDVRKIAGKWMITRLNLTLITFNPVFQTGAGC
jgi:hypothetical protein